MDVPSPTTPNIQQPSQKPAYIAVLIFSLVFLVIGLAGGYVYRTKFISPGIPAITTVTSPSHMLVSSTPNATQGVNQTLGWQSYTDSQDNFEFNYSSSYTITVASNTPFPCGSLTYDKSPCLTLNINTNIGREGYVPQAGFYLIKGINNVNLGGQVAAIKFNSQKNMWVYVDSVGETPLPIWAYTKSGLGVIKTSNGGSEGSSYYYIIPDYQNDLAAIFAIPQSFRLRCDFLQGAQQTACNNFYSSVINQYNNGQPAPDTWLPEGYMQSLYPDIESVVTSFNFINH